MSMLGSENRIHPAFRKMVEMGAKEKFQKSRGDSERWSFEVSEDSGVCGCLNTCIVDLREKDSSSSH